jgi:hypothetical protein
MRRRTLPYAPLLAALALPACVGVSTSGEEEPTGTAEQAIGLLLTEDQKVYASDAIAYTSFGYEVDIHGDLAVVGTAYSDGAYVFEWNGSSWVEIQKLLPSNATYTAGFGDSVAISGDTIAIGAGTVVGRAVYVFRRGVNGVFVQEALLASPVSSTTQFGSGGDYDALDLDGDELLVGDSAANAAYFYSRAGSVWSLAQTIPAPASIGFGTAVSIESGRAVVSGRVSIATGAMYVFEKSGAWAQTAVLAPSDGEALQGFAYEIDLSGDTIVSGGYFADDLGSHAGKGYIFDYAGGSWSESAILLPSGVTSYDTFGSGVAVSGDTVLVASPGDSAAPGGALYVFLRGAAGWLEAGKLVASSITGGSFQSVELDGSRAIAGNWFDNTAAQIGGSTFFYNSVPTTATTCTGQPDGLPCDDGDPCTAGDTCTAGSCAGGPGPDQDADGVCDVLDNCTAVANPSQMDLDANLYGDACSPACVAFGDVGLGSGEDAMISEGQPNGLFGTGTTLVAGRVAGSRRRSLLQFDISLLPVQTIITSAQLAIGVAANGGVPATVNAHNVLAPWSESTVTWNNFANAYDPAPLASFVNELGLRRTGGMETLVNQWIQGTMPNNGILLEQDAGPSATRLRSSEVPGPTSRPVLEICFTAPGY